MKQRLPALTSLSRPRGTTLRSDDGIIEFTLSPTAHGVFVERVQLRPGTARTVHSTLFADEQSFERWCDADAVRFEYPVVYISLKRDGDALFRQLA
jgi:hypothetical protein